MTHITPLTVSQSYHVTGYG